MAWLLGFTTGLMGRVFVVLLALGAAQFPVYYAQYLQTLAGARVEAQARYEELQREAGSLQLSAEDFIVRHESNGDAVFQASGRIHRTTLQRWQQLNAAWQALSGATALEKPKLLAWHFDRRIDTATHFTPGLPLTVEGAVYGGAGLLIAWLISAVLGAVFLPRRRQPRPAAG